MIERANDRARTATVIDSRRRSRDRIPADIQASKLQRAAAKRARKAGRPLSPPVQNGAHSAPGMNQKGDRP